MFTLFKKGLKLGHTKCQLGVVDPYLAYMGKLDQDIPGYSRLHWAAEFSHPSLNNLIITLPKYVNSTTNTGQSPLHYAAANGNMHGVLALIKGNADLNIRNNAGLNPFDKVMFNKPENSAAIAEILKLNGAYTKGAYLLRRPSNS